MTVLITGASGFLGKYFTARLNQCDIDYVSVGRREGNTILCDLSVAAPELSAYRFDAVIHVCGKAHTVPRTSAESESFFKTNVDGTGNLLRALDDSGQPVGSFVFISTVAVYGLDTGWGVDEKAPLLAADPYGKSKIEAEEMLMDWGQRRGAKVTILRLPLIAGANPPGNLGSMIKAIRKGYYLSIGSAAARRSIVLAEDVASLIPGIFEKQGIFNLTDGHHPSFKELEDLMSLQLGGKRVNRVSEGFATVLARVGDIAGPRFPLNSKKLLKLTRTLTFDDAEARELLDWRPRPVLSTFEIA